MPFNRQVFNKGDRVAVSHNLSAYASETVLRDDSLGVVGDPNLKTGVVQGAANDEKTYYDVKIDGGDTVTVTFEELVKVAAS